MQMLNRIHDNLVTRLQHYHWAVTLARSFIEMILYPTGMFTQVTFWLTSIFLQQSSLIRLSQAPATSYSTCIDCNQSWLSIMLMPCTKNLWEYLVGQIFCSTLAYEPRLWVYGLFSDQYVASIPGPDPFNKKNQSLISLYAGIDEIVE